MCTERSEKKKCITRDMDDLSLINCSVQDSIMDASHDILYTQLV